MTVRGWRSRGLGFTASLLLRTAECGEDWAPLPLGTAAGLAPVFDGKVPFVPLQEKRIGDYGVLEGRETAVTAQPFFVLPRLMDEAVVADALDAAVQLEFDDHNDEADWLPAWEVYIREKAVPLPGAAPEALQRAVDVLDERVMPFVRSAYRCPSCVLCTSFVRRYFPNERVRVPAHFDVTSFSTVVISLSPAGNYTGGFYVQPTAHIHSRLFVPMEHTDVAVYDFTLNHGVEVLAGGRWILANWVSENMQACRASATPWHANRAQNGDAVAQHILSMMYEQGNGAPQNDVEALRWSLRAAEGGLANAQFSTATMFFEGTGTERNLTLAAYWYEKAARQGDAQIGRAHV